MGDHQLRIRESNRAIAFVDAEDIGGRGGFADPRAVVRGGDFGKARPDFGALELRILQAFAPRCARRILVERLEDRKSVGEGKKGSVRVDLGGSRLIKKKNITNKNNEQN